MIGVGDLQRLLSELDNEEPDLLEGAKDLQEWWETKFESDAIDFVGEMPMNGMGAFKTALELMGDMRAARQAYWMSVAMALFRLGWESHKQFGESKTEISSF